MDPRWLEILKASSWQLGAIATALGVFWLLLFFEVLPPVDNPWIIYGLPLAVLVTSMLAIFGLFEFVASNIMTRIEATKKRKSVEAAIVKEQTELRNYIPYMNDTEKRILGYLLQFRQKSFTASIDGDQAATLLGKGFVRISVSKSQIVDQLAVPFCVPDHLWEILEENASRFPKDFSHSYRKPWHSI